jgi:hypothetical protein
VKVCCSRDVTSTNFNCPSACATTLGCGHECPGTCGSCHQKNENGEPVVKHTSCSKVCGRRYGTCNHTCSKKCHDGEDCGPCTSDCEVSHYPITLSNLFENATSTAWSVSVIPSPNLIFHR